MPHARYLLGASKDSTASTVVEFAASDHLHVEKEVQPMMQPMTDPPIIEPFVVEVWGKLAGVVLKKGDAFRFHAVAPPFLELDGAEFAKPGMAKLAAARLDTSHIRDTGRSLGSASQRASNLLL
jgi:hypothetical protein